MTFEMAPPIMFNGDAMIDNILCKGPSILLIKPSISSRILLMIPSTKLMTAHAAGEKTSMIKLNSKFVRNAAILSVIFSMEQPSAFRICSSTF